MGEREHNFPLTGHLGNLCRLLRTAAQHARAGVYSRGELAKLIYLPDRPLRLGSLVT